MVARHPEAAAPTGDAAKAAPATTVKEPGDAKVGDTAKCPVSGEEFTVEATSPKVEHDGKTYFFCCAGCKKKFEADPSASSPRRPEALRSPICATLGRRSL